MMAPSTWESSQVAVVASGRGRCLTMPAGASPALLDHPSPTGGSVRSLLQQMRQADPALYDHCLHVWALTQQLAAFLDDPDEEQMICARAALVHDVGKLLLPRTLLDKPARLTPQEYALMQQHPAAGARLLRQVGVEEAIVALVYQHHERWDGRGYPAGRAGLALPRGARLLAVAAAFAAMTTARPYQPARSVSVAVQELERGAGTQFDPLLVQRCVVSLQGRRCHA